MQNTTTTTVTTAAAEIKSKGHIKVGKGVVKNDTSSKSIKEPSSTKQSIANADVAATNAPAADNSDQAAPLVGKGTLQFATVGTVITDLVKKRDFWEKNTLRKANEELYAILSDCLSLYEQMAGNSASAKEKRVQLTSYCEQMGYRFNSESHTLTKIVKCVFGAERRRVSAYSIALRAASAAGVKSQDLPAFIREAGGVEEVRLASAPNAMTAKTKARAASDAAVQTTLGVFKAEGTSGLLDQGNIDKPVVLLGTWQADGSVVVRGVIKSEAAIQAALVSFYNNNKSQIATQVAEKTAANDADTTAAAVEAALVNSRAA